MGAIKWWLDMCRRRIDVQILWKICMEEARDLDHAKAAFMLHVMNDPAWRDHFSEAELCRMVNEL
jgi:hypothetical protein